MKKVLTLLLFITALIQTDIKAQCPPGAFAYQSLYPQCPSGCGVLLLGWPEGVLVNIYGGTPLRIITTALISGTLGNGGTGDAFTCVPCNTPLVYASTILGASGGCVIATIGIVPVKITNFSASSTAGKVGVKWSTSLESAPVKYVVQKSNNGRDYTNISTTDGTRSPLNNNYSYTDPTPTSGSNYYRIKVIEISGTVYYSETALIKNIDNFGFSIYPNPAGQEFKISLPPEFLPATVEIINPQGKQVYSEKINRPTSVFNKLLSKGIYLVKVSGNNNNATQRLIRN